MFTRRSAFRDGGPAHACGGRGANMALPQVRSAEIASKAHGFTPARGPGPPLGAHRCNLLVVLQKFHLFFHPKFVQPYRLRGKWGEKTRTTPPILASTRSPHSRQKLQIPSSIWCHFLLQFRIDFGSKLTQNYVPFWVKNGSNFG